VNKPLPEYTGPGGKCPKCRGRVETEYHWAGGCWAPKTTAGRESPCRGRDDLSGINDSEHLCRVCTVCGYGWPEACADASGDAETVPDEPVHHTDDVMHVTKALPAGGGS